MANYRVGENQNFLDIAIQKSGSILPAFDLAVENGLSVTDDLEPGQVVKMVPVQNADMADYLAKNNIVPATKPTSDDDLGRLFGLEFPKEFA